MIPRISYMKFWSINTVYLLHFHILAAPKQRDLARVLKEPPFPHFHVGAMSGTVETSPARATMQASYAGKLANAAPNRHWVDSESLTSHHPQWIYAPAKYSICQPTSRGSSTPR